MVHSWEAGLHLIIQPEWCNLIIIILSAFVGMIKEMTKSNGDAICKMKICQNSEPAKCCNPHESFYEYKQVHTFVSLPLLIKSIFLLLLIPKFTYELNISGICWRDMPLSQETNDWNSKVFEIISCHLFDCLFVGLDKQIRLAYIGFSSLRSAIYIHK
jgi:hypothetical protein